MFDVALAYPFSLGLVAAFNPCGFAMLPTYLAYFLGLEDESEDQSPAGNVFRGLAVGLTMTLGFVAVFGTFGFVTSHLVSQSLILEWLPWFTMIFGVVLVPLGIAMLFGFELTLRLPRLERGTGSRQLPSVFVFGVSYAVVSLGCTVPLFLVAVVGSFTGDGVVGGVMTYLAYAAGMGAVIVFLTMALALARGGLARNMRRVLPYVGRISGGLLVVAGAYLVSYGWYELRLQNDATVDANPVQDALTDFQTDLNRWIQDVGAGRIGLLLVGAIVAMVAIAQLTRMRRPRGDAAEADRPTESV